MASTAYPDNHTLFKGVDHLYHGFRPRKHAVGLMNFAGDYLLRSRTADDGSIEHVLTAFDTLKKHVHLTLRCEKSEWFLAGPGGKPLFDDSPGTKYKFTTILQLIEHYRAHPPSNTLSFTRAINRPDWMLRDHQLAYAEKDRLGGCSIHSVYKGWFSQLGCGPPTTVAVKLARVTTNSEATTARKALICEAQLMRFYAHHNVVRFIGAACDCPSVQIFSEFCPGGTLIDHLTKHGVHTHLREKLIYLFEAGRGMFYLHTKKLIHGAIAARNCLISSQGLIKIGNFGHAQLVDGFCSPPITAHPERWLVAPEIPPSAPSQPSDVWSFGTLIFEVFGNGSAPWSGSKLSMQEIGEEIRRGAMPKLPDGTPAAIAELTAQLWRVDPEKRPLMRVVGRELNEMIKDANRTYGAMDAKEMTVNKHQGVERSIYYEDEDTCEFESTGDESDLE